MSFGTRLRSAQSQLFSGVCALPHHVTGGHLRWVFSAARNAKFLRSRMNCLSPSSRVWMFGWRLAIFFSAANVAAEDAPHGQGDSSPSTGNTVKPPGEYMTWL